MLLGIFSSMPPERYEIIKLIRKDFSGGLYEAYDHQLGKSVAIRRFFTESYIVNSLEFADAFNILGQQLVQISHPNVSPIYEARIDSDGPYLVSSLNDSKLLKTYARQQLLSPQQSYQLLLSMLKALEAIHSAGFVHGFLSPNSISYNPNSNYPPQIIDLGLQQLLPLIRGKDTILTAYIQPLYLAPELKKNVVTTIQSDLYALAKICESATIKTKLFNPWLKKVTHHHPLNRPSSAAEALHLLYQLESKILPPIDKDTALVTQKLIRPKKTSRKKQILLGGSIGGLLAATLLAFPQKPQPADSTQPPQHTDLLLTEHRPLSSPKTKATLKVSKPLKVLTQQHFDSKNVKQLGSLSSKNNKIYYNSYSDSELDFTASGYTTNSGQFGIKDRALIISGLSRYSNRSRIRFKHKANATLRFESVPLYSQSPTTVQLSAEALDPKLNNSKDQLVIRLKLSGKKMVTLLDTRKHTKTKFISKDISYQISSKESSAELWVDILTYGKGHGFKLSKIEFLSVK